MFTPQQERLVLGYAALDAAGYGAPLTPERRPDRFPTWNGELPLDGRRVLHLHLPGTRPGRRAFRALPEGQALLSVDGRYHTAWTLTFGPRVPLRVLAPAAHELAAWLYWASQVLPGERGSVGLAERCNEAARPLHALKLHWEPREVSTLQLD